MAFRPWIWNWARFLHPAAYAQFFENSVYVKRFSLKDWSAMNAHRISRVTVMAALCFCSLALLAAEAGAAAPGSNSPAAVVGAKAPRTKGSSKGSLRFRTYLGCALEPQHRNPARCGRSDPAAFFRSPVDTHYTICVVFRGHRRVCARHRKAEARSWEMDTITTKEKGLIKVIWTDDGRRVVRSFRQTQPH